MSEVAKDCGEARDGRRVRTPIDDKQFREWTKLLEDRIGLFVAPERRSFLASGLRERMREIGCCDYTDYYQHMLRQTLQGEEWSLLTDCLTVHETSFFRHGSSLRLVEEMVLPGAFEIKRNFHAWSMGCATGEEAYTLAMLLDDSLRKRDHKGYFGVTGTDVSLPALRKARAGTYINRRVNDIRETFRARYCRSVSETHFEIEPVLRKRVCFVQLNAKDICQAPFAGLDLIYCQNLLIYYGREMRKQIVDRLAEFLCPAGVLVLGPGELVDWQHPELERIGFEDTLAFRRAK